MARQPIYDRRMKVFAYELLYRQASSANTSGQMRQWDEANALVQALIEIGLDTLVETKPAFINVPVSLLAHPALRLLPKSRVILELLEDIPVDQDTLQAVNDLVTDGYKLALDDFIFGSRQEAFIHSCKIVKVDVLLNDMSTLKDKVHHLKAQRVRLLAEKVETMDMFNHCYAMGFDYFQGYFFAKPALVAGKGMPQSRSVLIHLLTRLQDPMVGLDELETLVASDVTLSLRLLRLVNSACAALEERVESIRSALLLLGLEKVVALVSLLAMSGIQDKPSELMVTAMVRAKMCEGLAKGFGRAVPEKYFTVGLLSVLEAMFDLPMAELLEQLPLSEDLKEALLDPASTNQVAQVLHMVLDFEQGQWFALEAGGVDTDMLANSYLNAVNWADEATQALTA